VSSSEASVASRKSSEQPTEDEVEEEPLPELTAEKVSETALALRPSIATQAEPESEGDDQEPVAEPYSDAQVCKVWDYPLTTADKHLRVKHLMDNELSAYHDQHQKRYRKFEEQIAQHQRDKVFWEETCEHHRRVAEQSLEDKKELRRYIEQLRDVMGKMAETCSLPDEARKAIIGILNSPVPGEDAETSMSVQNEQQDPSDMGGANSSPADVRERAREKESYTFTQLVSHAYRVLDNCSPVGVCSSRQSSQEAGESPLMITKDGEESLYSRAKDVLLDLWDWRVGDGTED